MQNLTINNSTEIASCVRELERLKELEKKFKEQLMTVMEQNNIRSYESDELTITYVDSYDRETLDTKGLKKTHPDIYDSFVKMTTVKPSVRIKLKGDN